METEEEKRDGVPISQSVDKFDLPNFNCTPITKSKLNAGTHYKNSLSIPVASIHSHQMPYISPVKESTENYATLDEHISQTKNKT